MLHITNGDATRMLLERSSVPGTFSSWDDILHEGPTPPNLPAEEWRRVRVDYLASLFPAVNDIAGHYRREDEALERWRDHDEVVFWFEHDLYDQLLLIRHFSWLGDQGPAGATRLSFVCGDTYLGLLKPDQFPAVFERRAPITPDHIAQATRAWKAFCSDDPTERVPFAFAETAELPYLPGAIRRHLEDFPAAANGLARSEKQILRVLTEGTRTPEQTFIECQTLEERIFMGDWTFWTIARRLAGGPHPLIAARVDEQAEGLPVGTLDITSTGREVLAGHADQVTLNGVDRWMGGVRLTPSECWRWTGTALIR
ncbi:MAG TPA: DUF1835 domain-containing protein [Vicinamibacterales bacterium]|nr:DUF1835 domain-containing protein [Vicinamibacterales bacterium]